MTIELWVFLPALPALNQEFDLVSKSDRSTARSYECEIVNLAGVDSVRVHTSADGTAQSTAIFTQSLATGVWQHLAFVIKVANNVEFFINGVSQGTNGAVTNSIFDSAQELEIGAVAAGNFPTADLSLARIWSVARTSTEITNNMCAVLGSTTNLRGEWTLNNSLLDNSGNSNTLTNNGSITFTSTLPSTCTSLSFSTGFAALLGAGT